ncbi:MAG: ribosome maturation factor RimP [Myxococcota bacterium]|nr:ribosome maturation factor RimP [Deltaproteobacteria bacterium]MDQ3334686.1 ribosome maturation factor RimP [Myxococcota bacterium]
MSRNPQQQRLIAIVEPVCQQAGLELVDLRLVLEQGGWTLRVQVDLPVDEAMPPQEVPQDRVDLEDCENLSRELSAVLDVDDPITQAYSLEVGSPGIDRPLRTEQHFRYYAGSDIKVQLSHGISTPSGTERKNFRGVLKGAADGKLSIEVDGQLFELPIDDVDTAKLVPDWDAVMSGKSGVGAPLPKPAKPGGKVSSKKLKQREQQG